MLEKIGYDMQTMMKTWNKKYRIKNFNQNPHILY